MKKISGIFLRGAGASNLDDQLDNFEEGETNSLNSVHDELDIQLVQNDNTGDNMVQSFLEFLTIATKLINYKYDGDPLSLKTFINKVELLELATEQANAAHLIKYVISCLEGKALESLPENPVTLREIKDALAAKIKFDNSKVVEGRL